MVSPFFIFTDHDFSFHFWNPSATEFQNIPLSDLFRSDYSNINTPKRPQSTLYTLISLKTTLYLFGVGYILYGLLLLAIKNRLNKRFYEASKMDKLQHVVESLNLPEVNNDWDVDNTLSIEEHKELWKEILSEMMLMVGLQYLTNMMLLIPFFVTGTRSICFNHFHYLSALSF